MKIVINTCYGGFSLSPKAYKHLGIKWDRYGRLFCNYNKRCCPELIKCVEELGKRANGKFAKLKVVEVPNDINWEIEEYDGIETVCENHRKWR